MFRFHRPTMIAVTVLAVTLAATLRLEAQRRGFFPWQRANSVHLLRQTNVQEELKLDGSRKEKLRDIRKQLFDSFRDSFRGLSREERHKKFYQLEKEAIQKSNALLNQIQRNRLRQITLQILQSVALIHDDQLMKDLKLTPRQIDKIKEIHQETRLQRKKFTAGYTRKDFREQADRLRKEFKRLGGEQERQSLAELNEEQIKRWNELKGSEFKFKFRRR